MAYSDRRQPPSHAGGSRVTLAPWEYLFESFNRTQLPGSVQPHLDRRARPALIALIVLYIVRTRALHKHPPYIEMWEWLWWTGLITFSLILVGAVFVFDFFLILAIEIVGIGDAGLDPLPALPAVPRRVRPAARQAEVRARTRSTPSPRPRSASAAAVGSAAAADAARRRACPSRSAGSASVTAVRTARSVRRV